MNIIPILSTSITAVFIVAILRRYCQKRRLHLLFWGIGLIFYGLGTLSEVVFSFQFDEIVLKIWYISGAMLTAAWLGQGTVNLLVRRKGVAGALNLIIIAVSILAFVLVLSTVVSDASSFDISKPVSEQYKDILPRSGLVIALTIILNIYGTITLVGGALYSAFIFLRKNVLFNRMIGNILIAVGALMPAIGGTLLKAGYVDLLYLSELLGVILIFIGYIWAIKEDSITPEKA